VVVAQDRVLVEQPMREQVAPVAGVMVGQVPVVVLERQILVVAVVATAELELALVLQADQA
jgi:hypothetical protein